MGHQSQLISLMQALRPKEVRELRKFLKSPFFNQRKDVVTLFDFLDKKIRNRKVLPAKEKIFLKVYPNKKFDAQAYRQLLSWLQQLIEKYLAYQAMIENELDVKLRLATLFRERDLSKHYQKTIRDIEKCLNENEYRDANYYRQSFLLEQEKYLLASGEKRMASRNFQSLSDDLNINFILQKLRQACQLAAHQAVYNFDFQLDLLSEVLEFIEKQNLKSNPVIATYLYCYNALIAPDREDHFRSFIQVFFENSQRFSTNELRDLFLLAINFCIRRLNQGYIEFAKEGLNLYQNAIENEVLFLNGTLSRFTFQNIVAMGLKVKEFDWVGNFIQTYHHYLPKEHKHGSYAYNMAMLSYHRKNYDEVLRLLQLADYQDVLMSLSAKTLASKVYFEIGEDELLDAHLHTMQMFITRKKVMGYHRKNYLNFIKYLKKLLTTRRAISSNYLPVFESIQKEEVLTQKKWFIEQIELITVKK